MGREIERKFLVEGDGWRTGVTRSRVFRQGYLAQTPHVSVRVRLGEGEARLTIKGAEAGTSRAEFEYAIPAGDARELLALREGIVIEKTRHDVPAGGDTMWEIDEFAGALAGLVLAEIELADETQAFERPAWLGREVTDDPRYYNAALAASGRVPD